MGHPALNQSPTSPLRVGLTGGIGSGKSLVGAEFTALGVPVLDADAVAREIVIPGSSLLDAIVEKFGGAAIDKGGQLRRNYLRERIFTAPQERRALESILHPRIRTLLEERAQRLAVHPGYCVISIPLLVESGWQDSVDHILVVDAPEETRIKRVLARDGLTREQVEAIMRTQASPEERLSHADDVIVNDGDGAQLRQQVETLHHHYVRLARSAHER
jgi:dephospho-CoA kinase